MKLEIISNVNYWTQDHLNLRYIKRKKYRSKNIFLYDKPCPDNKMPIQNMINKFKTKAAFVQKTMH